MSKEVEYRDIIAYHPGTYVEDIVDDLNITQAEFAKRLSTSPKTISKIINGEDRITSELANKLAKLTGISIKTWLNLQASYDEKVMEIEDQRNEDEERVCQVVDFSTLKVNEFIENKRYSLKEKKETLRKLLNISNLSLLTQFNPAVSYRHKKSGFDEKSIINSNVMLELALNESRDKTETRYNKGKLESVLPIIKKMTQQRPDEFWIELKELLLSCGIVLVALPSFSSAGLHGAIKKFKNGSVMLLITDRSKKADIFWFSLIHELGHIYNEDFYPRDDQEAYSEREKRADDFSANFFINAEDYKKFVENAEFNYETISTFAKKENTAPDIIVGRLKKDKYIEYGQLNDFNRKYNIQIIHE